MALDWQLVVDGRPVDVGEATLHGPKQLTPYATRQATTPQFFTIFRSHESHIRQLLGHLGVPTLTSTRKQPDAVEVGTDSGRYETERPWLLTVPPPYIRKHIGYAFKVNGKDPLSPTVFSTRKTNAKVENEAEAGMQGVLPYVSAEAHFRRVVKLVLTFAVDPDVEISLLTGSELADHVMTLLANILGRDSEEAEDTIDEQENSVDLERDFPQLRDQLTLEYRPPHLWTLDSPFWTESPAPTVSGSEGEQLTAPLDLALTAPQSGTGYFAFLVHSPEAPEDDEVSDIFALEVTEVEEGYALRVITDFEGAELHLGEIA